MAIAWWSGFFMPLIEVVFIGAIIFFVSFFITKAFFKAWRMKMKWFFKYSLFGRKYPEKTLEWTMNMINMNMNYWKTKQYLLIKGASNSKIDETMWIYLKVLKNLKGGLTNNGRTIERSFGKNESPQATELPNFQQSS